MALEYTNFLGDSYAFENHWSLVEMESEMLETCKSMRNDKSLSISFVIVLAMGNTLLKI